MGEIAPTGRQIIEEVDCLYVPLHESILLVPMSAIAEVVQTVAVTEQEDAPVWFDGWLEWRQKRVPLISFEALGDEIENDKREGVSDSSSALIINTLSPEKGLSYYAIQAQGFSNLVRIAEDDPLQQAHNQISVPHVLMQVKLDDQVMQVPDLVSLESYLADSIQAFVKKL